MTNTPRTRIEELARFEDAHPIDIVRAVLDCDKPWVELEGRTRCNHA
jgi:hypothetical protein